MGTTPYLHKVHRWFTMARMDALRKAIHEAGGAATLARRCGVTRQAIQIWKRKLPAERVLDISRACEFRVTPHQLAPHLYPHPDDAVPAWLRSPVKEAA